MAERISDKIKRLLPECLLKDRFEIESSLNRLPARQLPSAEFTRRLAELLRETEESCRAVAMRFHRLPELHYPESLPISRKKSEILECIRNSQVMVLAGETGSGKTTQIPKMCLEAGRGMYGKIGCTQPRRVAALSVSRRVAEELNVRWGREVGCKIRFRDESRSDTYIKFMTDGILLAETQGDPNLYEYDTLIIDEAHERSLNIDFLLGHLKQLLEKRPDLKVVITSATIDTESFSKAFNDAPILEVSGRMYPVEVMHLPLNESAAEEGEVTYIDAAVNAVEMISTDDSRGDILIFMPGERDIRETTDKLEGRRLSQTKIIPLFGRLSAGDQERVFAPARERKIVIATNIAETSLTIPGIRYVVDSGLARVSRYSPRTRTRRLPIEPVSQSSANQRKGRCGRVSDGVCIRLYSEEDFELRREFTQPEIQRANLAEVILRMKAWRLGDIETFPFINPPHSTAIQGGYQLLLELGAIDADRELTPLGKSLARLPIDPTIGRMILQSKEENALKEALVIAAGLSVQDPRERPMDNPAAADQAHKKFQHPESDFLTLLNIWNAYHDTWDSLKTQNQLRKFCRTHFLSYLRIREWREIHGQVSETLKEIGGFQTNKKDASYDAVHRSILSGLLGQIGVKKEPNLYKLSGNREALVFPGSGLFLRKLKQKKKVTPSIERAKKKPSDAGQPEWMVAGEIVETNRLYARTVAGVKPQWIAQLGRHICKATYRDPQWNAKSERVRVKETVSLHGLTVLEQWIDYGKVNPKAATEIFIRSALVEDELEAPLPFLEHNRKVLERIAAFQTRMRQYEFHDLSQRLYEFYAQRIRDVSSVHDLNRLIKERSKDDPEYLRLKEEDLTGGRPLELDERAFPTKVSIHDDEADLHYAYAPGEEHDGVTLNAPSRLVHHIRPAVLDWMVPGLREEKAAHLLKALPKSLRRELAPFPPKAREIAAELKPEEETLEASLAQFIFKRYGVRIPKGTWGVDALPNHLKTRVELTDKNKRTVHAGRDLEALRKAIEIKQSEKKSDDWDRMAGQWERFQLAGWTFGDPPGKIEMGESAGAPLFAWTGLQLDGSDVHLRLFRSRKEALAATPAGWRRLCEIELRHDLAWLQKDLKALDKLGALYVTLGAVEELRASAYQCLARHAFDRESPLPLKETRFRETVREAREFLKTEPPRFIDLLREILESRQKLELIRDVFPFLRDELNRLLPGNFLLQVPFERLEHYPRYLKALAVRVERARLNPVKDREREEQLKPYRDAVDKGRLEFEVDPAAREEYEAFRWMVEEYKVSVFAQELGTSVPVSPKRLKQQWEKARETLLSG